MNSSKQNELNLIAVSYEPDFKKLSACAEYLADKLNLPLVKMQSKEYSFLLVHTHERLELRQVGQNAPGAVYVDFASPAMRYRLQHYKNINQMLLRAVGLKSGFKPNVFDATPGLGRDAFIMASFGCNVTMCERSPIVASLLKDGLNRAMEHAHIGEIAGHHLKLICGDSKKVLSQVKSEKKPDTIYLDPMYPQRTKSALVKKEMRFLRAVIGEDQDAPSLLKVALSVASKRVTVKRPRYALCIEGPKPNISITGKKSRFDVYFPLS